MGIGRWIVAGWVASFFAAPLYAQTTSPLATIEQSRRLLQQTLKSSTSSLVQKDEAAKELLERQTPGVSLIFHDVLSESPGNRDAKIAVAHALAGNANPDPQFIALLSAMMGPDRNSTEAAAGALAHYRSNADAQKSLLDFSRDGRQPAGSRVAVIRVLGNLIHPAVAAQLIDLLADASFQSAAADALHQMTGLSYENDVVQWRQWQAATPKDEVIWIARIQAAHAALLQDQAQNATSFANGLRAIVENDYKSAPNPQKDQRMGWFLGHSDPQMRRLGIDLYSQAFINRQYQPPVGKERIPALLGDSDKQVRLDAAQAVRVLNLVSTPTPILAQLAQEPDQDVRAALVTALRSIQGGGPLPTLIDLLRTDPSLKVVMTIAGPNGSIQEIGVQLAQKDHAAAMALGRELWAIAQSRGAGPRGPEFRAAIIRSLGPLVDPDQLRRVAESQQEPEQVRVAALLALGDVHNENMATRIARDFQSAPNPDLRIAAMEMVAHAGTFEANAPSLFNASLPDNEGDARVRDAALRLFQTLLQTASDRQNLKQWSQQLRNTPEQQIPVQKVLVQRLGEALADAPAGNPKANLAAELASEQQSLGEAYIAAKDFKNATDPLRQALAYWKSQGQGQLNITAAHLVDQLMIAFLEDGQFKEACNLAGEQISDRSSEASKVQSIISNYAESLKTSGVEQRDAQKLNEVLNLVQEAMKLNLEPRYKNNLDDFQREVKVALNSLPRTATIWNYALSDSGGIAMNLTRRRTGTEFELPLRLCAFSA